MRNKKRGYEHEAATRNFWLSHGFKARRTLASGAYKKQLGVNEAADGWIEDFSFEAKRKKSGFKFLYDSIGQDDADILVIKQDRCSRLYVLPEDTLLRLMRMAYDK